jgi:hypothetical protein
MDLLHVTTKAEITTSVSVSHHCTRSLNFDLPKQLQLGEDLASWQIPWPLKMYARMPDTIKREDPRLSPSICDHNY